MKKIPLDLRVAKINCKNPLVVLNQKRNIRLSLSKMNQNYPQSKKRKGKKQKKRNLKRNKTGKRKRKKKRSLRK